MTCAINISKIPMIKQHLFLVVPNCITPTIWIYKSPQLCSKQPPPPNIRYNYFKNYSIPELVWKFTLEKIRNSRLNQEISGKTRNFSVYTRNKAIYSWSYQETPKCLKQEPGSLKYEDPCTETWYLIPGRFLVKAL